MFLPHGVHFRTLVAPMWDDVTDEEVRVLLTCVYRLENLHDGMRCSECAACPTVSTARPGARMSLVARRP